MYALRPKTVDFDRTWQGLEQSVMRIISLQPIDRRVWFYNFSDVYSLCVAVPDPLGEKLYEHIAQCLNDHVADLYQKLSTTSDKDLLSAYHAHWTVYYEGTQYIHNLFEYLNKQFVKQKRSNDAENYAPPSQMLPANSGNSVMEVGQLSLSIWRRVMIAPLERALRLELLQALRAERGGTSARSPDLVKSVIHSFVLVEQYDNPATTGANAMSSPGGNGDSLPSLELYRSVFEDAFLDATSEYYTAEASRLLSEYNISQYMEKVITLIDTENMRSIRFLHTSSHEKVTRLCQEVMVNAHKERLYAVCADMVNREERHGKGEIPGDVSWFFADLRNMYRLLRPLPQAVQVLTREFEAHVRRAGLAGVATLNSGENVPQNFVDHVLAIYNKFNGMVADVFNDDGDFVGALDRALQATVNFKEESRQCPKASERLARYCDTLLRKSAKGMSEKDVDDKLAMAIVIFRYIDDKDIFQKFYSKMLATRLIHNASVSMEAEESMITKLKHACGYEFTSKLSRMFTDVGLSKELTDKFHKDLETKGVQLPVGMYAMVLQSCAWPLSATPATMAIPQELQPSLQRFESFYAASHSGRKLTWLFNLANAEVRLNYLDKPYQVTMSIQQLALLLCFAGCDRQTMGYLERATELTGETLERNVRTLIDAGLIGVPAGVESAAEKETREQQPATSSGPTPATAPTMLDLNMQFQSKRLRFKLTAPLAPRAVEKEAEIVNSTVHLDRKHYMECTIVRIMKTRKQMKHNALVNEVIEHTKSRFTPDINFIKKNIESLIEKLYIQRTEQKDEYQYLA